MAGAVSTLEVRWTTRRTGSFWPFVDFVVDGRSLLEYLGWPDQITALEGKPRPVNEAAIRQLLMLEPTELVDGRQAIYICPECGDLGCGAISAVVELRGDFVVWEDFASYNPYNYDENAPPGTPAIGRAGYEGIGPFIFDAEAYAQAIRSATDLLHAGPPSDAEHR